MPIIVKVTEKGLIQEYSEDAPASFQIQVPATDSTGSPITGGGGGTPGGSDTNVQYNSGGSLAGSNDFTYDGTLLYVSSSFSQGISNTASGLNSHAEGEQTTASADGAHAEGYSTTASAQFSHAEGSSTTAGGYCSHAEGVGTVTSANFTHAEGNSSSATQEYAHAEGVQTTASGYGSHSEGDNTQAVGDRSHAEGYYSIAEGQYSHAEGEYTQAIGQSSHAEGYYTIASGSHQNVCGKYNLRNNDFSLFIVGNGTGDDDINRSDVLRAETSGLQVSGSMSVSGSYGGNVNVLTGAGTIDSSGHCVLLTSDGAGNVVAMSDGSQPGQLKYVVGSSGYGGGNTSVITPTSTLGYTTVTFDASGDAATFLWTGSAWAVVGSNGASIV